MRDLVLPINWVHGSYWKYTYNKTWGGGRRKMVAIKRGIWLQREVTTKMRPSCSRSRMAVAENSPGLAVCLWISLSPSRVTRDWTQKPRVIHSSVSTAPTACYTLFFSTAPTTCYRFVRQHSTNYTLVRQHSTNYTLHTRPSAQYQPHC